MSDQRQAFDVDLRVVVSRLESLDSRFETYVRQTTDKLDILIDLTRQMAAMQERQQRHTDDIIRLEQKLTTIETDRSQSVSRVYDRIENVKRDVEANVDRSFESIDTKLGKVSDQIKLLDTDYQAKQNFMKGAMRVLAIVFVMAQGIAVKYISDLNEASTIREQQIQKVERQVVELQSIVLTLSNKK